ncbi:MAG: FMN-binding protein [Desulfitobacteriaceae bacterium]
MKKKTYQIIVSVVGVLVIGFGIFYSGYLAPSFKQQKIVRNMQINEVDLSKIPDGTYQGDFGFSKSYMKWKFHSIESIKVLGNGTNDHAKKAEGVLENVLSAQSLKVDVVTGATTTSKALLKATENALNKGIL